MTSNLLTLYHYTFHANFESILQNGLRPSRRPPLGRDAHHGEGHYFTDLSPLESSKVNRFQHAYALTTGRFYWGPPPNPPRMVGWIEFVLPSEHVKQIQPLFGSRFPERSIFLHETIEICELDKLGFTGQTGVVRFPPSLSGIQ
jgi:hypothetical protein